MGRYLWPGFGLFRFVIGFWRILRLLDIFLGDRLPGKHPWDDERLPADQDPHRQDEEQHVVASLHESTAVAETVSQEIVEFGDLINLGDRPLELIVDAPKFHSRPRTTAGSAVGPGRAVIV